MNQDDRLIGQHLLTNPELLELLRGRLKLPKLELFPWFFPRCKVRILMYADGGLWFTDIGFGLSEVRRTVEDSPWWWVEFEVTTAHRSNNASTGADITDKRLDELNLKDNYDEVWLFGIERAPSYLTNGELNAIHDFMDNGGGVLVTGDHEDLGGGLASGIKRAGKMRLWDVVQVPVAGPDRRETLREGPDPNTQYEFDDQSDVEPQQIRLRLYRHWGRPFFGTFAPHPVLCGPKGPIDILPDHMHEGEVTVPATADPAEWPNSSGYQPKPEVIAWGRVLPIGPGETAQYGQRNPREFPVIGAYNGHLADVGRIVADSTWHHWININLIGDPGNTDPAKRVGFLWNAAGVQALEEIRGYFHNVSAWLAPPSLQRCMRRRLWWGALYLDPLIMIPPKLELLVLGRIARDALGKYAPQCLVYRWWYDLMPIKTFVALESLLEKPVENEIELAGLDLLEEMVMGETLRALRTRFPEGEPPQKPPDEDEIDRVFEGVTERALEQISELQQRATRRLRALVRDNPR